MWIRPGDAQPKNLRVSPSCGFQASPSSHMLERYRLYRYPYLQKEFRDDRLSPHWMSLAHQGGEVDVLPIPSPVLSTYLKTLRLAKGKQFEALTSSLIHCCTDVGDADNIADTRQKVFSELADLARSDVCHNEKLTTLCSLPRDDLSPIEARSVGRFCQRVVASKLTAEGLAPNPFAAGSNFLADKTLNSTHRPNGFGTPCMERVSVIVIHISI